MSKHIEYAYYLLRSFSQSNESSFQLDSLYQRLLSENEFNIEAQIQIGNVEVEFYLLTDYSQICEILTGDFYFKDEVISLQEKEALEDRLQARIAVVENRLAFVEESALRLSNSSSLIPKKKRSAEQSNKFKRKLAQCKSLTQNLQSILANLDSDLEELRNADFEYDEILNDYLFRFSESINIELAQQCGLGVVELEDGERWLFHTTCGMDMSPRMTAYAALEFGCIPQNHVSKFRDLSYFKDCVGPQTFKAVCEALEITHCLNRPLNIIRNFPTNVEFSSAA